MDLKDIVESAYGLVLIATAVYVLVNEGRQRRARRLARAASTEIPAPPKLGPLGVSLVVANAVGIVAFITAAFALPG